VLKEVSGDILLSKAEAIAHGVAPGDHFNQGLALSLREHYPAMAKDFRHYCQLSHPKPGEIWASRGRGSKLNRPCPSFVSTPDSSEFTSTRTAWSSRPGNRS